MSVTVTQQSVVVTATIDTATSVVTNVEATPTVELQQAGGDIVITELQGPAGPSAYQVAVNNGFVGTETEWLNSLNGASHGGTWGTILGTLSDQTDLNTALTNLNNAISYKADSSALSSYATTSAMNAALANKENAITSGTTAQYWRGDKTWQTLNAAAVSLGNVDNTSDANKPVSTAQQAALDLKANLSGATFTGAIAATNLSGTNTGDQDLSGLATTSALTSGLAGKEASITAGTTAQYWRGDKTWQTLATVATTGAYADLTGKPTLATVATSGLYSDLTGKPTLATVATSGLYSDLTGKPALAAIATSGSGADLTANSVTLGKLATQANNTILGNISGSAAAPAALTATQVTALLNTFTTALQGLVPASGGGTTNFLRADGTWAQPAVGGTGTVTSVSVTTANGVSGSVATATTTPAITLTLGAITPSSVAASGSVSGSNLSGTNTGDQFTSVATGSFIANNSGATGAATAVSSTNATAMLQPMAGATGTVAGTKGLVPAPSTANFTANAYLKADGSWSQPAYSQISGTPTLSPVATSGSAADLATGTLGASRLPAFSGDVSSTAGQSSLTIGANKVTRNMLGPTSGAAILGASAAGNVSDLTGSQVTAMLTTFTTALQGVVPASGGGTTNFLRADGTWAAPPAGGGGGTWGSITGTLSSQTDLQNALNALAPLAGATFTGAISATNLSGTNTGDETASSIKTKLGITTLSGSNTGDQTITLTGDVTGSGTGSFATAIGANKVTRGMLAATAAAGLLGATAAGNVSDLTPTQVTAMLNAATQSLQGMLSASDKTKLDGIASGATANTGTVTSVSVTTANGVSGTVATSTTTPAITLSLGAITPTSVAATGTVGGSNLSGSNTGDETSSTILTKLSGASGGGTTNFLRADGTWAAPAGGGGSVQPGLAWTPVTATGTGASQGVTIPETGLAATDILVFVNGVLQVPTTNYTVSDSTVTLTTDNSGDNIQILKPAGGLVQGFTLGMSGKPGNTQRAPATAPYAFTVSATNSKATALVAATASTVFTLKKGTVASPTTIGTFTFAASGTVATVSISAGSISAGDTVWIEAPATADSTCADITFLVRS